MAERGRLFLLPLRTRVKVGDIPDEILNLPEVVLSEALPINVPPSSLPRVVVPETGNPFAFPVTGVVGDARITPYSRTHTGVDFGMPCGQPVSALRHGVVSFAGWHDVLTGNAVILAYDDGVYATFAHLRDTGATYVGEEVWPDTTIGFVGDSGSAQGCHLHLELHYGPGSIGAPVDLLDPLLYFAELRK